MQIINSNAQLKMGFSKILHERVKKKKSLLNKYKNLIQVLYSYFPNLKCHLYIIKRSISTLLFSFILICLSQFQDKDSYNKNTNWQLDSGKLQRTKFSFCPLHRTCQKKHIYLFIYFALTEEKNREHILMQQLYSLRDEK